MVAQGRDRSGRRRRCGLVHAAGGAILLLAGLSACSAVPPAQYARARGGAAGSAAVLGTPELYTLATDQRETLAVAQPEYARLNDAVGAEPRSDFHRYDPVGAQIERVYRWDRYQVDRVQLLPLSTRRVPGW